MDLSNKLPLSIIQCTFLTLSIIFIYSFALDVPFYLDDFRNIRDNSLLLTGTLSDFLWKSRFVGTLTFYYQYQLGLNDLAFLHGVNIFFHVINTLLVFIITTQLINLSKTSYPYLPFLVALIFAIHPLNTQPVVYIVQRYTLIVTTFYLSVIVFYINARQNLLNERIKRAILGFGFATVCFVLGWFSKQNIASVIIVIAIIEIVFFNLQFNKRVLQTVAVLTALGLLSISLIGIENSQLLSMLDKASRETDNISRIDYFLAQLNILWIYIGKFIIPTALKLEYSIFSNEFSMQQTIVSGGAHVLLLAFCLLNYKKKSLVCFAILFYYSAHLVESSVIPIRDLAFEHRTYLPNFGLALIFAIAICWLLSKPKFKRVGLLSIVIISLIMTLFSIQRLQLWQDKKLFLENELAMSPNNTRLLATLAKFHRDRGNKELSDELLSKAYELSIDDLREDVAANYLAMLVENKEVQKANTESLRLLASIEDVQIKNQILHNLGVLNYQQGNYKLAKQYFTKAIKNPATLPDTYYVSAIIALKERDMVLAENYSKIMVQKFPNFEKGKQIFLAIQQAKKKFNIQK